MLQDFIRMLDGKREIEEELCFGVKTLRCVYYFKTISKVDYENWWKEVSSFVAAPIIKRSNSKYFTLVIKQTWTQNKVYLVVRNAIKFKPVCLKIIKLSS